MKCDFPAELLSGYIDNELNEKNRVLVEDHIKSCQCCQQEIDELKRQDAWVRSLEVEEPSREFMFSLKRRVMENVKNRPKFSVWKFMPVLVPVAAAALVLVVVINSKEQIKYVGIDNRISVTESEFKTPDETATGKKEADKTTVTYAAKEKYAEPVAAKPSGAVSAGAGARIAEDAELATMPPLASESRKDDDIAAGLATEQAITAELEIPRDRVIRAIVDSTGKVLKVATGNTIVPEEDTLLENRLEGQQLAPPTIRGKRTQMYVDLSDTEQKDSLQ